MNIEKNNQVGCAVLGHSQEQDRIAVQAETPRPKGRTDRNEPVERVLLTVKDVAVMLSISCRTVHRLVARGALPGPVKVGSASRFTAAEVQEFVDRLMEDRRDLVYTGRSRQ